MILTVGIGTVLNEIVPSDAVCPTEVGIQVVIEKMMNIRLSQTILSRIREDETTDDGVFKFFKENHAKTCLCNTINNNRILP